MKHIISAVLLCVAAAAAQADEEDIYSRCINQAGGTNNAVVLGCSVSASDVYKKKINRAYQKIYTGLKADEPEEAQKLENSQKAWLAYRNNHCELMGKYVGSPMYDYCPMELNKQRSEELEAIAEQF